MDNTIWLFDDGSPLAEKLVSTLAGALTLYRTKTGAFPEIPPETCRCALLPLGSVDGGLDFLRKLRDREFRGSVVFYADAPPPEIVRAIMISGGQDVVDPRVDSAELIQRVIALAPLRREAYRESRKGVESRRAWVQDRFSEAQGVASVGSWEVDVHTWIVEYSPQLRSILGLGPDQQPPGVEGYMAFAHPDDRERVKADLLGLFRNGRSFDCSHRIVRRDGSERFVDARGRCELTASGKVHRAYGTVHDVTDMRRMEETVRRERDFKSALLGAIRDGYTCTHMGILVDVNNELLKMTGFKREELIGTKKPFPFWPADETDRLESATSSIAGNGGNDIETVLVRKDGTRFDALLSSRAARGANGAIVGFVTTIRDITDVQQRRRIAEQMANEDGLTGLLTRRAFDSCLRREHARVSRGEYSASLVIFDIDKYKNVNDTFGHPVGDSVLKEMADRLRSIVRSGDVVGRLGGDELAWVISGLDLPEAAIIAERLRDRIASVPFKTAGSLTISIGVASLANVVKAEDAYAAADKALYGAKKGGRNRVALADVSRPALAA